MGLKGNSTQQKDRLKELCTENEVSFDSMQILLDSVKTKKLLKRNNYHQQRINDIIEQESK
jgi:hypothetical protein